MSLFDVVKSLEEKFNFKKSAVIGGISFEFSLLNYAQDQMINSFPDEGDDPISFYEKTRAQVLSYALVSIGGEVIPEIVEVQEGDKTTTKEKAIYIREVLKKIPPRIVEQLFEVYIDFKDEMDTKIGEDIIYQWYKTPEQRKVERDQKEKEEKERRKREKMEEDAEDNESDGEEPPEVPAPAPEVGPISFKKIEEKDDDISQAD
jgi:hypothetical protein